VYGSSLSALLLSPFLTLLGVYYHAHGLVTVGTWFSTTTGVFVCCLIFAVWATLINLFGLRVYAAFQRWSFFLGVAGLFTIFAVLLFNSHRTFVNNINHFMATNFKTHNAYQQILHAAGPINTSTSLHYTLLAVPLVAFSLIFPAWSAMQSGEIKRAGTVKWNMYAIVGAEVLSGIIAAIGAALLISRVGAHFFSAAGTLSASGSSKYTLPTSPYFTFFAALMSTSPLLTWVMCITAFGWILMWLPNGTLASTRMLLAMSLDGLLPEWWGRVNRKTHTPNNAIFALAVSYVIIAFVYLLYPHLTAFFAGITLLSITGFAVTNLAGAVMPWKSRALFESAPEAVRTKIGPIPLITISGVIFAIFAAVLDYLALTQTALGVNTTEGLLAVAGVYVACAVLYAAAWNYRRRRGFLDLGLTYQELPVE
jgi:basic amino acid/polyamine antiporter, APA family